MRVFRIEQANGRGICAATGSPLCNIYYNACGDENEHCSFCYSCHNRKVWDSMDSDPNLVFAFPTMWALHSWFPQARGRKLMEANGARGVEYEVASTEMHSQFQCVFDKSKATKVREFPLEN
jgi:hypothetical protein